MSLWESSLSQSLGWFSLQIEVLASSQTPVQAWENFSRSGRSRSQATAKKKAGLFRVHVCFFGLSAGWSNVFLVRRSEVRRLSGPSMTNDKQRNDEVAVVNIVGPQFRKSIATSAWHGARRR